MVCILVDITLEDDTRPGSVAGTPSNHRLTNRHIEREPRWDGIRAHPRYAALAEGARVMQ
jgi:hypothetical protein